MDFGEDFPPFSGDFEVMNSFLLASVLNSPARRHLPGLVHMGGGRELLGGFDEFDDGSQRHCWGFETMEFGVNLERESYVRV